MKKIAVLLAVVLVAALAAPALSATNPFMDVPMNHWAYDAIGQLAAHGILSGYPDGTYKGKQATTRYEMASALARALAVVDMTKASKQDVEMLKRLVVEFKDELEALGVRVDELDERVAVLENRLGGWHIHGTLALDVKNQDANNAADKKGDGSVGFDEARIFFERTFGENDEYFFRARLRDEAGKKGAANETRFDRFYVEMPFFFDSRMTVGRFNWDWEDAYRISLPATGSWTGDSILTDWTWDGFGLTKNFGLGTVSAVAAHPDAIYKDWMIMLNGSFQFTEQIGFDIGGQAFVGDNAEINTGGTDANGNPLFNPGDTSFNSLWTVFAGLRFQFNDNIAFKGAFYHQAIDAEDVNTAGTGWQDLGYWRDANGSVVDDANHWRVVVDVKQPALKYTSVWLEYGQYDMGFWAPEGMDAIFPSESKVLYGYTGNAGGMGTNQVAFDTKYWRVGLGQEWNEKWATHIFYYGYNIENGKGNDDAKPSEYGLGVQYKLNDATTMGLNYIHVDNDQDAGETEDNIVRFRTKVVF